MRLLIEGDEILHDGTVRRSEDAYRRDVVFVSDTAIEPGKFVDNFPILPRGVGVVFGPPGLGKTTTISTLATTVIHFGEPNSKSDERTLPGLVRQLSHAESIRHKGTVGFDSFKLVPLLLGGGLTTGGLSTQMILLLDGLAPIFSDSRMIVAVSPLSYRLDVAEMWLNMADGSATFTMVPAPSLGKSMVLLTSRVPSDATPDARAWYALDVENKKRSEKLSTDEASAILTDTFDVARATISGRELTPGSVSSVVGQLRHVGNMMAASVNPQPPSELTLNTPGKLGEAIKGIVRHIG